jgi:COP9 signalosome complex subunit 4
MSDSTSAETNVNKAAHLLHKTEDRELQMRYKRASVQVLDSKRQFILAAQGYYNLSFSEGIDSEEVQDILRLALTCTLLAPAGPRKARLVTVLHKDERLKSNQFYELLSKVFVGEVVKREHVTEF